MKFRIDYIRPLPDNVIAYEDFFVKYLDNDEDLRKEAWEGGYCNSLWACYERNIPVLSNLIYAY